MMKGSIIYIRQKRLWLTIVFYLLNCQDKLVQAIMFIMRNYFIHSTMEELSTIVQNLQIDNMSSVGYHNMLLK